jgi:hypothetical protein
MHYTASTAPGVFRMDRGLWEEILLFSEKYEMQSAWPKHWVFLLASKIDSQRVI